MPEVKPPPANPLLFSAEATVASMTVAGASAAEILRFARSTVGVSGGRATLKKYGKKHFSRMGKTPRRAQKLST